MAKLKLKTLDSIGDLQDYELFCESLGAYIGSEDKKSSNIFFLTVVSTKWIKNFLQENNNKGFYLRYALVLDYYDEKNVEIHIKNIIRRCNAEGDSKSFNCLKYYLRYEYEEDEY